jgi:capsular polysaccharide transport system permease protein
MLNWNFIKKYRLFIATVVVPTLIASIYYGMIASDIYISESQFVVRSPEKPSVSGLGAILQGTGIIKSQDDSYMIHDFILSRDALSYLDKNLSFKNKYSDKSIDFMSRFNGLGFDNSFEELYQYYHKQIETSVDTSSGISTLKVKSFSPVEAYEINKRLIEMSELLVNRLNERARKDMIHFAESEVERAVKSTKLASSNLSNYRSNESIFDPEKQSALQLQLVSKLQDELILSKTQLGQMKSLSPDNPQIGTMQRRVELLQQQINSESGKITNSSGSLAKKASAYDQLSVERIFTEKQLASALAGLEQARSDAARKQLYLERLSKPIKPDSAVEPHRIKSIAAVFILGLILWGILGILNAGVREHYDR